MKRSVIIIAVLAFAAISCSTQKQMTSAVNDDVYYTASKPGQATTPTVTQAGGAQVISSPDQAAAQKPASSTLEQDYNDYSYANRINRFNSTDTTKGYFDDHNNGGSSSQGVSSPDVSLYIGAGYGAYSPSYSFGFGWGYPSYGWYDPWYNPYYGWGYPYYGWGYPYYGWYSPYYPCYCCYGYYDYGYNSTPYYTNDYYGARNSRTSNDGTSHLNSRSTVPTGGQGGESTLNNRTGSGAAPAYSRSTTGQYSRSVPANQERYHYTPPAGSRQSAYQRSTVTGQGQVRNGNAGQGGVRSSASNQATGQQPAPRYSRPREAGAVQRTGTVQNYSSPVYRQPKSSQEYIGSQGTGASRSSADQSTPRSGASGQGYRQGSGSSGTRTYSSPSRSSESSSPSRSGSNYSAPSRSSSGSTPSGGSNYSAPSRSGGGSSPSGGSSSGGGRRR